MKRITKEKIGICLAALLLFISAAIGQESELKETKWMLTAIDGKEISSSNAYLEFDRENGKFVGHTGCNRMFGTVARIPGRQVEFKGIGTTKMACLSDDVNRIERSFLEQLSKANYMRGDKKTLQLLDGSRVALKFRAMKDEPRLDEKKWVLESVGKEAITLTASKPFVNIDLVKDSIGGNTGCNVFGGNLTVNGNAFDASQMISTMRACEEEGRMTIERQLLDGIEKADRFELKAGKLMLFAKDEMLLTFIGEAK